MRNLILLTLILLVSCNGGGGGGASAVSDSTSSNDTSEESNSPTKGFWNTWMSTASNYYLNLQNGEWNTVYTKDFDVILQQQFITALSNAGRNVTGLVANDVYRCTYSFFASRDIFSPYNGTVRMEFLGGTDTPDDNACLQWDNTCDSGNLCNFNGEHEWSIKLVEGRVGGENVMTIDYFGDTDGDVYGSEDWD